MDNFAQLKRRTTDLVQSIPDSFPKSLPKSLPKSIRLPQLPSLASYAKIGSHDAPHTMKGTWQRIAIPSLPRSSHSIDVVAGTAYVFGGESASARQPVDNSMHAIILPTGSATADYYAIPAAAAKPVMPFISVPTIREPTPDSDRGSVSERAPAETDDETADKGKGKDKEEEVIEEIPLPGPPLGDVPEPRVGHATAVIGNRIFLFGGRGGASMSPLDERGRVWVFDTRAHTWSFLDPKAPPLALGLRSKAASKRPIFPAARSYHAAVALDQPAVPNKQNSNKHARHRSRAASWKAWAEGDMAEVGTPQRPIVGNIAAHARDVDSDGYGTFFIHGGCLADGGRTNDLWAFDVRTRVWRELPVAPGLPRGGTAICISGNRLYRFGGFNGSSEEGGRLDFLTLKLASPDDDEDSDDYAEEEDKVMLATQSGWNSLVSDTVAAVEQLSPETKVQVTGGVATPPDIDDTAAVLGEGVDPIKFKDTRPARAESSILVSGPDEVWPGARSVASLEAVSAGGGWEYLVLALGERSPSGAGHEAAGQFWDDVWAFQVPSSRFSAAGVSDAVSGAVHNVRSMLPRGWLGSLNATSSGGHRQVEGRWARLVMAPFDTEEAEAEGHGGEDYGPGARGWLASARLGELEENAIVILGGLNDANKRLGDAWILRLGGETSAQS